MGKRSSSFIPAIHLPARESVLFTTGLTGWIPLL